METCISNQGTQKGKLNNYFSRNSSEPLLRCIQAEILLDYSSGSESRIWQSITITKKLEGNLSLPTENRPGLLPEPRERLIYEMSVSNRHNYFAVKTRFLSTFSWIGAQYQPAICRYALYAYQIIKESPRLENTSEIIQSNHPLPPLFPHYAMSLTGLRTQVSVFSQC